MSFIPNFPTKLHQDAAEIVRDYFLSKPGVDTVLVVNSCARGQAVAESDLDIAILAKPGTDTNRIKTFETDWLNYSASQLAILRYKQSTPFSHLHLDIITGNYIPAPIELGEPIDNFEIEIGNQICYSAPMDNAGPFFLTLESKWLPYYNNDLRSIRLQMVRNACNYDLDHIPFLIKRGLYFHAFYILNKAFQEFLQAIFIANKTYPIAYNKWIKEQVVNYLKMPDLYPRLSPILSVKNIESREMNDKAKMLRRLLSELTDD
jgi:predicted nucleotidyltransferase